MSKKESRRVYVMEQVMQGKITVRQAAEILGLSERQIKRLKAGIKEKGLAALAHGNRGRKPKHAVPNDVRTRIVELALGEYRDASYQHMSSFWKSIMVFLYLLKPSAASLPRLAYRTGIRTRPLVGDAPGTVCPRLAC